ncbi:MAG: VOC family protein, partial [Pseudomonadota bacterium]
WMINFRVDDLDAVVKRLREADHKVEYEGNGEPYPNGRFAKLLDPEGNAIQLWEPGGLDPG